VTPVAGKPMTSAQLLALLRPTGLPAERVIDWAEQEGILRREGKRWVIVAGSGEQRAAERARVLAAIDRLRARRAYEIVAPICEAAGCSVEDIVRLTRGGSLDRARGAVYHALLTHPRGYSSVEVGEMLGRDHSTILHGAAAHRARQKVAA